MFRFEGTVRVIGKENDLTQSVAVCKHIDNLLCDWSPISGGIQIVGSRSLDAKISYAVNEYKDVGLF